MWTKATVDEVLKRYMDDKARAAHLVLEIDEMQRRVNTAVKNLAADEASPKAQVITDMPHGTGTTNPTEEIAIKVASGWLPPEIREMKSELDAQKAEYKRLDANVRHVEAWMMALTERENWILRHQFMRQEFWRDVLEDFSKAFGGYATKETLKRLRAAGLKKIYQTAGIKN